MLRISRTMAERPPPFSSMATTRFTRSPSSGHAHSGTPRTPRSPRTPRRHGEHGRAWTAAAEFRQCGACSPRPGDETWAAVKHASQAAQLLQFNQQRMRAHSRRDGSSSSPTSLHGSRRGRGDDAQPFTSALLELSAGGRRWKLEATRVLAAEVAALEARIAQLESTRVETAAAHAIELRECEARVRRECEVRRTVDVAILCRALEAEEARAGWYEHKLGAALAIATTPCPVVDEALARVEFERRERARIADARASKEDADRSQTARYRDSVLAMCEMAERSMRADPVGGDGDVADSEMRGEECS